MILLQPENYDRVKPLLANLNHQTVIMTTLSGATPSKIYVDKPNNPGFAFVQFKHRAFFAGDMKSLRIIELENFIDDIVLDNCRIWDVPLIRLSAETEAGINDLQDLLQERQPIKVSYLCYQFDLSFPAPVVEIPEGFSIQQINSVLMESEFEDKVELLDEMHSLKKVSALSLFMKNPWLVGAFQNTIIKTNAKLVLRPCHPSRGRAWRNQWPKHLSNWLRKMGSREYCGIALKVMNLLGERR